MPRTDMPDKETPDRESIKSGDRIFILTFENQIVCGEVSSTERSAIMVKYKGIRAWGEVDVSELIPYVRIAFRGVYGGMVMGETIKERILSGAA